MRERKLRVGLSAALGALLVGALVLMARSGVTPVDAAPANGTPGPGSPSLGGVLQRAALVTGTVPVTPTEPVTYTSYLPWMYKRYWDFDPIHESENFEPPWGGWPYGSVRNTADVAEEFAYGYLKDSDGSNVYYISIRDNYDHVFVTGPMYVIGENWKYEAWVRRASDEDVIRREYGILISPTPIDPAHPKADNVYTLQLRLWDPVIAVAKKWNVKNLDQHPSKTIGDNTTNHLTKQPKVWNQLRIRRVGNTLHFEVQFGAYDPDGYHKLYSYTPDADDPPLDDRYYIGFFAANNEVSSWRQWQFDNVRIDACPAPGEC